MNKIKKGLSGTLAALILLAVIVIIAPVKADVEFKLPEIDRVFEEHIPLAAGERQSFFVTSKFRGKVQYKLWFQGKDGNWHETPYTEPVDPKIPIRLTTTDTFKPGKNNVAIWIKEAGEAGMKIKEMGNGRKIGYDNSHLLTFQCVPKAELKSDGKLNYITEELKIIVNGIEGMDKNTEYKICAYDYKKAQWIGNGEVYEQYKDNDWTQEKAEFKLPKKGTYLINVYARRVGSNSEYEAKKYVLFECT